MDEPHSSNTVQPAVAIIPWEIILDEILPRLPAKSLVRFKCISKNFKTRISSPNFVKLQLRLSLSSPANRLLILNTNHVLHSFELDSLGTRPSPIPLPDTFRPDPISPIVGSCNGLVLIRSIPIAHLLLANPSTGFYSAIPRLGWALRYLNYGFGYDPLTEDYKVIAIRRAPSFIGYITDVYSVRGRFWYSVLTSQENMFDILANIVDQCHDHPVLIKTHLCHWLFWCRLRRRYRIVCFDLCSESWTTDVPLPNYGSLLRVKKFGVLGGRLFVSVAQHAPDTTIDVWVMKEYGVVGSWAKLFHVPDSQFVPLAYGARGSSSKVLLRLGYGAAYNRLIWYDIGDQQSEMHYIHGIDNFSSASVFTGSLVTVPREVHFREEN